MATLTQNLFYGVGESQWDLTVTEGTWPIDAGGAVFIIGPDKRRPGGHWFNESGMVLKIECAPSPAGKIRARTRRIHTPIEQLKERFPALFKKFFVMEVSPFGFTNMANTNLQPIGDRLFVGYDVGRPLEIDPETLDFLTPVGSNGEWEQGLPGLLEPLISVAAHPAPAHDEGALYFVNYNQFPPGAPGGGTWIARWDMEGKIKRWNLEGMSPFDSIHDIKATRDYLVITDLPFVVEPRTFRGKPRKKAAADITQMWIVAKEDLRRAKPGSSVAVKELRIPMASGHILVDYENPGGELNVFLQHIPTADLAMTFTTKDVSHASGRRFDGGYEGMINFGLQPTPVGRYRVNARTGELLDSKIALDAEGFWSGVLWSNDFYNKSAIDHPQNMFFGSIGCDPELVSQAAWDLYRDYANPMVPMDALPTAPVPGTLSRIDLESMEFADQWKYPEGSFPHPPTYVPRKNAQHDKDGYVVTVCHRDGAKEVHIFDAASIGKGPLARATSPDFIVPLMLHSCWMPARSGPRPSRYRVNPVRDALEAIAKAPAKTIETFGMIRGMAGF